MSKRDAGDYKLGAGDYIEHGLLMTLVVIFAVALSPVWVPFYCLGWFYHHKLGIKAEAESEGGW